MRYTSNTSCVVGIRSSNAAPMILFVVAAGIATQAFDFLPINISSTAKNFEHMAVASTSVGANRDDAIVARPIIDAPSSLGSLLNLEPIASTHPALASQFADAKKFAYSLPSDLSLPRVWTDGETEVALEWIAGEKHAIASFEGGGNFGYAMRRGNEFVPVASSNNIDEASLGDLIQYLAT